MALLGAALLSILVPHLVPFVPTINHQHKPVTSRRSRKLPASMKHFRVFQAKFSEKKKNIRGGKGVKLKF